jgi:branched-chain amino acid transport system permease protein
MLLIAAGMSPASDYAQSVAAAALAAGAVGAALVLLVGLGRVISLASGAMMAIGAYGAAIAMVRLALPFPVAIAAAILAGALAGALLALPALRFHGHHLAMLTLVFQYVVVICLRGATVLTGGALGLRMPPAVLFGADVSGGRAGLWMIAIGAALVTTLFAALATGRFGDNLRLLAASDAAAASFGINGTRFRIATFVLASAALAGVGALLAPQNRILDPESFGINQSIVMLSYPVVGGLISVTGGALAGFVIRIAPELLRGAQEYQELILALIVVVIVASPTPRRTLRSAHPAPSPQAPAARPPAVLQPVAVPALEARGLRKAFDGLTVFDGLDLVVGRGTIHGIIGPNGAGKTTLFNAISGLDPADAGMIQVFGEPLALGGAAARLRRGVTRTFQHIALNGNLTLIENVLVGLGRNGLYASARASLAAIGGAQEHRRDLSVAAWALDQVGLLDRASLAARRLSLGDQRRLELARALASQPRLLMLDEPVAGLPAAEEARVLELLQRLNARHDLTILVVEHNIRFMRRLCHRVSVMSEGRIVAEAPPEEAIALPVVRQLYLGGRAVDAA